MPDNQILITGGAGFIGYHLSRKLAEESPYSIHVIDNLNSFYDIGLKEERLSLLGIQKEDVSELNWLQSKLYPKLYFRKLELSNQNEVRNALGQQNYSVIIHLAAQAGVRFSLNHPEAYVQSNMIGFFNILEIVKSIQTGHFLFASSSSVYGGNREVPFSEDQAISQPLSFYAASKASNEMMAYAYSSLHGIPTTALRFFTAYGPLGRPDMAYYKFAQAIAEGSVIDVFNFGKMKRDFTYIDDIVQSILLLMGNPPSGLTPFEVYNIGHHEPVELGYFISLIERALGKKALIHYIPQQPGEMLETFANVEKLKSKIHYVPQVSIEEGMMKFIDWFRSFHKIELK